MEEDLQRGERVLAQADGSEGRVTATDRRLLWPDGSIGWHEIERASWDADEECLRVEPVPTSGHHRRYRLPLSAPGRVVDVVREQVTGSVIISRHVPLEGRRGVRVTGRRKPDGELVWSAVLDRGVDPEDQQTRSRLDAAVAEVRSEVE